MIFSKFTSLKSNTLASRPSRHGYGECASLLLVNVSESRNETRQFIAGSDDIPVSMQCMYFVFSRKHSSRESKPDILPKTPYHGVQACAGIISISFGTNSKLTIFTIAPRLPSSSGILVCWFGIYFAVHPVNIIEIIDRRNIFS